MNWRSAGLVFAPDERIPWMRSHASLPVAWPIGDGRHRVYFASRDERNRSHVGFVELDVARVEEPGPVSAEPVLAPGPLGHFDDHGVYAASIVAHEGQLYLYYIGWNPGRVEPLFYSSIGLAVSSDGGLTFEKVSRAPIMARSEHDPCLVTSPFVMIDGGKWRMWYVSGVKWTDEPDGYHSFYHIKYAESADGIEWRREGHVCLDQQPGERNIARPCVRLHEGTYHMWFSYDAGAGYRIGYAQSPDGYEWLRRDELARMTPSASGFDSEAQAYPWVVLDGARRFMLYNGNSFGKAGFGLAVAS